MAGSKRALIDDRTVISLAVSAVVGAVLLRTYPFPGDAPLLAIIHWRTPWLYAAFHATYVTLAFTTPLIVVSLFATLAYVFWVRWDRRPRAGRLPPSHVPRHETRSVPGPRRSPPPDQARALGHALLAHHSRARAVHRHRHRRRHRHRQDERLHVPYADQFLGYRAQDPARTDQRPRPRGEGGLLPQAPRVDGAARARRRLPRDQPRRAVSLQPAAQRPRGLRAGLRHRLAPQQPLRPRARSRSGSRRTPTS